jgi:hypothetical protein
MPILIMHTCVKFGDKWFMCMFCIFDHKKNMYFQLVFATKISLVVGQVTCDKLVANDKGY